MKEKRCFERITVPNVFGAVELKGQKKEVSIINASSGGVCISGLDIEIGTVLRLHINQADEPKAISLYCKVVWADSDNCSGLALLNTNRILFEQELESFGRMISDVSIPC